MGRNDGENIDTAMSIDMHERESMMLWWINAMHAIESKEKVREKARVVVSIVG
jgi:hypothetical protein